MPPFQTQEVEKLRRVLTSDDTFATSLLLILLDEFGTELFEWEPETVILEVVANYQVQLPDDNIDKIWTLITALTTNQFYVSFEMFNASCQALMGDGADFSVFTPADPEQLAWGVAEVMLLDPPQEGIEFSQEVSRYVGLILEENGIMQKPKTLSFAEFPSKNPILDLDTLFEDDPQMFQASWSAQRSRAEEVDAFVKNRMHDLLVEVNSLPLMNKDPEFDKRLKASIQSMDRTDAERSMV